MLRLQLVSTGEFFVMGKDALSFDLNSTLFNKQDEFLGSKTLPGTLPLEPNRRYIRNSHYINTANTGRQLQVMMWLGYLPYKEVKMTFTIEGDKISYTLYIDSGIIGKKLKSLKLNELVLDGPSEQINFGTAAEYLAYINSTVTAGPGTMPMVFFPYKNDGAYTDIPADQQSSYPDIAFPVNTYMNAWQIDAGTGDGSFIIDMAGADASQTQTPFFYVTAVLQRIFKYLGYSPYGNWMKDPVNQRLVIFSNVSNLSFFTIPDITYFLPATPVSDFLKEVRSLGVLISFDQTNKTVLVESLRNIRTIGPIVDMRAKQLAGTFRETGQSPEAYTVTRAIDDKDGAYTPFEQSELPALNIGDVSGAINVSTVELISVNTKMIIEASPAPAGGANWRIPYIKMPVYPTTPLDQISPLKPADMHDFKLRFLYYHGMVENSAGYLYPYGSSDNLDLDLQQLVPFTLALSVAGTAYSSTKEYYAFMKASKPFEIGLLLKQHDMVDLRPESRILLKDFDNSTVVAYFDMLSGDLDDSEDIMAKATVYPDILEDNVLQYVPDPDAPELPPPVDNGEVYVKLVIQNYNNQNNPYPPPAYQTIKEDLVLKFYADAAGTIAKDVVNLGIILRTTSSRPPAAPIDSNYTYIVTSAAGEYLLRSQVLQSSTQGGSLAMWEYELVPHLDYHIIS